METRREQKSDASPEPDMNRPQQKQNPQFAWISFSEKRTHRVTYAKWFSLELNLKLMYRSLYKVHWITPVIVLWKGFYLSVLNSPLGTQSFPVEGCLPLWPLLVLGVGAGGSFHVMFTLGPWSEDDQAETLLLRTPCLLEESSPPGRLSRVVYFQEF